MIVAQKTLIETLDDRARVSPDRLAFTYLIDGEVEGPSMTFLEFQRRSKAIAAELQKSLKPGDRALLLFAPGLDYITAFFGCLYAGIIAVPAYPPDPKRLKRMLPRLVGITKDCSPKAVLSSQELKTKLRLLTLAAPSLALKKWIATDVVSEQKHTDFKPVSLHPNDVAFLQYTSGSTGVPKGVMVTHGNIVANCETIRVGAGFTENDRVISWLPLYHDMGLIGQVLHPVYSGLSTWIMSPIDFLREPLNWLKAISKYRGTASGGPNFAYDLCASKITEEQKSGLDLSSWKLAFCGAEPIRDQTVNHFKEAFSSCGFDAGAFYACYGLAEATLMVSGSKRGEGPRSRVSEKQVHVGCGTAKTSDTEIIVVDPETCLLTENGAVGEIWVRSDSVAIGYWNRKEQTEETFHAVLSGDPHRKYLRTGDLGFQEGGELYVTGRLKDLIIVAGQNHYPSDIEESVYSAHSGLRRGCAAAFSVTAGTEEKLVVVVEVKASFLNKPEELSKMSVAIRGIVSGKHDLTLSDLVLLGPGEISKTTSGKIQRRANRDRYLKNEFKNRLGKLKLKALSSKNKKARRGEVDQKLQAIIAAEFGMNEEDVLPHLHFGDLGISSIKSVSLASALTREFGINFSPADLWRYKTVGLLAKYLSQQDEAHSKSASTKSEQNKKSSSEYEEIAVVGISCRFPGGADVNEFWKTLVNGEYQIRDLPNDRWSESSGAGLELQSLSDGAFTRAGYIDGLFNFDPLFFGISPREAKAIDPQQRLLLQTAWHAIEDAGYKVSELTAQSVGVFIGASANDYARAAQTTEQKFDLQFATGNSASILANRISYFLNFSGPSKTIDAACSSSLVAIHDAARALQTGECQIALAGGVNAIISPEVTLAFAKAGMLSPSGKCFTFDHRASGYVRGEGVGIAVLKKLKDAKRDGDRIYGIIRGSAVNHGGRTYSLTAPNPEAQSGVIAEAHRLAGFAPKTISYIEAHGTATPLGDPIEINGLKFFIGSQGDGGSPCKVGSVKTNIGHLEAAAGIAGFLKVLLSMRKKQIPKSLHFEKENSHLNLKDAGLELARGTSSWNKHPLRAGVSSFGWGGTNCHIALEAADDIKSSVPTKRDEKPQTVVISAKSRDSLVRYAQSWIDFLETSHTSSLNDLAFTSQVARDEFELRLAIEASSRESLLGKLRQFLELQKSDERLGIFTNLEKNADLKANSAAASWVSGRPVDWKSLWKGESKRVELPLYPFDEKAYSVLPIFDNQDSLMPISAQNGEFVFAGTLRRSDFFVRDHVVADRCIVPAVMYLELTQQAVQKAGVGHLQAFRDVVWLSPIVVTEDRFKIEIKLSINERDSGFEITSGADPSSKVVHSRGKIDLGNGIAARSVATLEEVKNQFSGVEEFHHADIYSEFNRLGLQYGLTFRAISNLQTRAQDSFGRIDLHHDLTQQKDRFYFNPSLFDAALGTCIGIGDLEVKNKENAYIPFSLQEVRVFGPIQGPCHVWARKRSQATDAVSQKKANEVESYDVTVFDLDGKVLVECDGVYVRLAKLNTTAEVKYFAPSWVSLKKRPRDFVPPTEGEPLSSMLVIDQEGQLFSKLDQMIPGKATWVRPRENDFSSVESICKFLEGLTQEKVSWSRIFYYDSSENIQELLSIHLRLYQAIQKQKEPGPFSVIAIGDETIDVLEGFSRSILSVSPQYHLATRIGKFSASDAAQLLVEEMRANVSNLPDHIHVEDADSKVRIWKELKEIGKSEQGFKDQGVYVVSGGGGGIGALVAKYLEERYSARVVRLGRSARPDLTNYFVVDVADERRLGKVLDEVRSQFGGIDGVLHVAGVQSDQDLMKANESDLVKVLRSKVDGLNHLDFLTQQDHLDLFISFSSTSSLFGDFGAGGYSAANRYMDRFMAYRASKVRSGQRKGKSVSINWPLWANGGMDLPEELKKKYTSGLGMSLLSDKSGVQALEDAIQADQPNFAVLCGDSRRISELLDHAGLTVQSLNKSSAPSVVPIRGAQDIDGFLGAAVGKILGIDPSQLDREKDLLTYGLDSLSMMELLNQLKANFGDVVRSSELFQGVTLQSLASLIRERAANSVAQPQLASTSQVVESAVSEDGHKSFELSHAQRAMWFIYRMDPQSVAYNIPVGLRISGELDERKLKRAIRNVTQRQSALRTIFEDRNGEPVQWIEQNVGFEFTRIEVPQLAENQFHDFVKSEVNKSFDLEEGPAFRGLLFKRSDEDHLLVMVVQHIVFDGMSVLLLIDQVATEYRALLNDRINPVLPGASYKDFVEYQQNFLKSAEAEKQFQFWKSKFSTELSPAAIPTDRTRPPLKTYAGATYRFKIDAGLTDSLRKLAAGSGATLYSVLLSSLYVWMNRYSGQSDLVVGTPVLGREAAKFEQTIGYFVNMLALRQEIAGNTPFKDLVGAVQKNVREALSNQAYPFPLLVDRLGIARDPSRTPLFDICFVFQNMLKGEYFSSSAPAKDKNRFQYHHIDQQEGQFDIELEVMEGEQGLNCHWKYNTDLFHRQTIGRMVQNFLTILESCVGSPEVALSQVNSISKDERIQVVSQFNQTERAYPKGELLHGMFERQVELTPSATALEFRNESLSYREFNQRANQLAHWLKEKGVGPDSVVGVFAERSIEMMISIYGILKAGGAYMPLDPTYPDSRIQYMLQDSQPTVVLTQKKWLKHLSDLGATKTNAVESLADELASLPKNNPIIAVKPEHLAYIIYTSGSTGQPKGVMVPHSGICNRLIWMQEEYGLSSHDKVIQKTPFCFDVSVWELFWPLLYGSTLSVAEPEIHKDSYVLAQEIQKRKISILHFVPSMLELFLEEAGARECKSIRAVICSGEALPLEAQRKFFEVLPHAELHNLYGPTEASVDVTYWKCEKDSRRNSVPIGRPIANTQIYILDDRQEPLPIGVAGELCIGGVGLARGYMNKPELTQDRFVETKLGRLYRTGDLARFMSDGTIEYLGRLDHQIKLRGFRIELGEIERVLGACPEVQRGVVVAMGEGAAKQLVAYYVAARDIGHEIKAHLKKILPEYMIPSFFMQVSEIPLSANGKVDRKKLPEPNLKKDKEHLFTLVLPRDPLEEKMWGVWKEVLKHELFGVQNSFFDLGGNSLLSIRLVHRLNAELAPLGLSKIGISDFYRQPTIEGLSQFLRGGATKTRTKDADLLGDVRLDPAIRFDAPMAWDQSRFNSVLFTGATGFLGAYLVHELLKQTDKKIYCLVRAKTESEATQRVISNLKKYGLWDEKEQWRLKGVCGDVGETHLGMTDDWYRYLAGKVAIVYHNAAKVNFLQPYDLLKKENVLATEEVIRFATDRCRKTLHYISTISVFASLNYTPENVLTEQDQPTPFGIYGGYAQSKWVAEQIVGLAYQRGLSGNIYRPGTISGDSKTGIGNADDLFTKLLAGTVLMKKMPSLHRWVDVTPVDFAAKAIVALSGHEHLKKRCFHIVNPAPILQDQMLSHLKALGYPMESMPYDDWCAQLSKEESNPLYALLPVFTEVLANGRTQAQLAELQPRITAPKTDDLLTQFALECPGVSKELIAKYVDWMFKELAALKKTG